MKTFNGLKNGDVIHNDIDGDMTAVYTDLFSYGGDKELWFADKNSLWKAEQFDPADWEIKK